MNGEPARGDLHKRRPRPGAGLTAVAFASLAACASPPPPRAPASEQSLRDIGGRNDDAADRAVVEQRGRTRAEADVRAAERREAARMSAEQQ